MDILRGLTNMPEDHTTNATVAREHRFRGTDAAGRNRRTTGQDDGAIDGARVASGTDTAEETGLHAARPREPEAGHQVAAAESRLRGSEPGSSRES